MRSDPPSPGDTSREAGASKGAPAKRTTYDEVERYAQLFSWTAYSGTLREKIYLRGDMRIHVQFSRNGAIVHAERYRSFSLQVGSAVAAGTTNAKNKRTTVLGWLTEE